MESINKYKKLFIALILIIGTLIIGTKSQAEYQHIFTTTPSSNIINHNFNPYSADPNGSWTFYCIHRGSPYKSNLPKGYEVGDIIGEWCSICSSTPAKPWGEEETKTMTYHSVGGVNDREYQDVAYVIASAYEAGKITDMTTQWSIWNTALNIGHHDDTEKGEWGKAALEYKNFYNKIHSGTDDIYSSKVYDKTTVNDVTVTVNQTSKEYIVGPFVVEYPKGEYGNEKWSYITNITLLNQENNAIGNVVANTIHIIDDKGIELRDTIKNNNFPNSNAPFYVKFFAPSGNIDNIKLKVDFAYLESCSATLQKYEGTLTSWVWETVTLDKKCDRGHFKTGWRLKTEQGGTPQEIVAFQEKIGEEITEGKASKNPGKTSLIVAPSGIDLTMKISGQVFLDQDSGKVNVGNNIMDGQNEALQGVEVVLYDAETDQVVTKTSKISKYHVHTESCYTYQDHVHTGDPYTGGGCYTVKIHDHIGNWENGGACYNEAVKHVHSEACYTKPRYHTHTPDCGTAEIECTVTILELSSEYNPSEGNYLRHRIERHSACGKGDVELGAVASGGGNTVEIDKYTHKVTYKEGTCTVKEGKKSTMVNSDGSYNWVYATWHSECGQPDIIRGNAGVGPGGEVVDKTWTHDYHYGLGYTCGKAEGQIEGYDLGCGRDDTAMYYKLTCTKELYGLGCDGTKSRVLTCDKSNTIEKTINTTLANPVITDEKGYYEFDGLDSMKKYYVKFVYNGMLYTNVLYDPNNTENGSKATETRDNPKYDYRTTFNDKFAEIGSYPANYKIGNKVFGEELGDYNKTYLQKDIVEIFKKISEKMVNTHATHANSAVYPVYNELRKDNKYESYSNEELKRMIQFAADCRIESQTVQNYPLTDKFTISEVGKTIGNVFYAPIYSGKYDQLHVNLGIKARPAFDMKLDKNVKKVEVSINGKNETYNYDPDANIFTPRVGITEDDYIDGMRRAYVEGKTDLINSKATTYEITRNDLNIYVRPEEMTNGQLNNKKDDGSTDSSIAQYDLSDNDKLKVLVTYRIKLQNQASSKGAVTEIVDYYDTNFEFIGAYFGDENGVTETNGVKKEVEYNKEKSKYEGTEKKATKNGYKTIYLQPTEKMLGASKAEYIYVTFKLINPSELLTRELMTNNSEQLSTMNLAEINGYKTEEGLIDIDSTPGNFDIKDIDNLNNIKDYKTKHPELSYEDDAERAQALVFKRHESRTIEGTVFEDGTGELKQKDGQLNQGETGINGVIVELIEIKYNNAIEKDEMIVRATTMTHNKDGRDGWYGFTGMIPGDYVIRYTYGSNNDTALTTESVFEKGLNAKSYNGQDYQSTTYTIKGDKVEIKPNTDSTLSNRYKDNNNARNDQEHEVQVTNTMTLDKYNNYWYTVQDNTSDAKDYAYRVQQVQYYARNEYGKEIVNHKAEVFNSYMNPQPEHINNDGANKKLVNELERRTYRYAYTPVMEIEVEYATKVTDGNIQHAHKILGVDFGLVERPKEELTLDQDVKHIKVTLADGRVLFDTDKQVDNLQWLNKGDINQYDKKELINIIMDEELINGATLEITYNLIVTNNSEQGTGTTRAKNIINYVANNLNFDVEDNKDKDGNALWKVVSKDEIQNNQHSSFVNKDVVDLSTQSIILKTTENNPLTEELAPGEQKNATLKLKKVLSAESSGDDLTYTNMAEIVEIENKVGRYDHEATPGNQKLEEQPREHDTAGASKYVELDHDEDGKIIVTPPTGSTYIYYVIGITASLILAVGIFLIKKFIIDSKK